MQSDRLKLEWGKVWALEALFARLGKPHLFEHVCHGAKKKCGVCMLTINRGL